MSSLLHTVGVFGTSTKAHEKRVPIHPDHIMDFDESIRKKLFFEKGYGKQFDVTDDHLADTCGGVLSRSELFTECDIALLVKPGIADFNSMKDGHIHFGWPHCVQKRDVTQAAIDKHLTLIAFEAMHLWSVEGSRVYHSFNKNNELAGYAGVHHALNLLGIDGNFGPERVAIILGYGSVAQGAVKALLARGVHNITVLTQHKEVPHSISHLTAQQVSGVRYGKFAVNSEGELKVVRSGEIGVAHGSGGDEVDIKIIDFLAKADIIVNGTFQDTDHPLMFVTTDEAKQLKNECLIADISCDEGMGFGFAKATGFDDPMFKIGHVHYYGVDHTPSYLWNAASWEISKIVMKHLPAVMAGETEWDESQTIRRAIEIKKGEIINPKIISFQNR
eukprot:GHVN01092620.1.p1 GENE.GHVN01092620.1~~GHVN01092620.1.p1  ORF type:complete len:389 (+),score=73.28 GHVN01092620.1:1203-2369(+)